MFNAFQISRMIGSNISILPLSSESASSALGIGLYLHRFNRSLFLVFQTNLPAICNADDAVIVLISFSPSSLICGRVIE